MYDFIEREVKDAMRRFTSVKHRSLLCYRVEVQEIPELIDIGFEFAGGATISVEDKDLFLPNGTPGTLCLGITRSLDDDMIIIGAISMQGYNIGYNDKYQLGVATTRLSSSASQRMGIPYDFSTPSNVVSNFELRLVGKKSCPDDLCCCYSSMMGISRLLHVAILQSSV
ncbi:hypothetical protein F2Q68_00019514 [Brassica cretica]|uniref:Peptidase A1 domain-containing protein n=1 Tax=Brassica cretica TaxID=69181 RepID=A0A8S9G030_BRACR|nr:hypothetical protein F2Q68_00019514 [Brassica cretica]